MSEDIHCPECGHCALGHPPVCRLLHGPMSGRCDGELSPSPASPAGPPAPARRSAHQVGVISGFHGCQVAQGRFGGGDGRRFPEEDLVLDGDFGGLDSRPLPTNKHACKSTPHPHPGVASPCTDDAPITLVGRSAFLYEKETPLIISSSVCVFSFRVKS